MSTLRAFAAASAVALVSVPLSASAQTCPMVLDFDTDGDGNAILAGQDTAAAYTSWGITGLTWNTQNMSSTGLGIAFDSANPTGGDWDLQTPGYGPGNTTPLANLLISAENFVDANNDGLIDDPDDDASGAWFEFFFNAPTCIFSVDLIDIEGSEARPDILAYNAAGQVIQSWKGTRPGDNSVQTVDLDGLCGVDHMMIDIYGSGAVDNLVVCVGGSPEQCDGIDNDGDGSIDEGTYGATTAFGDQYGGNAGGHSIVLTGAGGQYRFNPNGQFVEDPATGTATLTGVMHQVGDVNNTYSVNVTFTGATAVAPPNSPKNELQPAAYVWNGGPIDPSTYTYYTGFTGTMTGGGNNAGNNLTVSRRGPAFQIGFGASGKNINFGASGWINWTRTSGSINSSGTGDFNMDFVGCIELCDGVDNDGDGLIDEGFDVDNDGWTTCAGDCDDNNPNANPSCPEACNAIDDDCDGSIDEDFDLDGDGYTTCNGDCDDTDASINPGAAEICDGVDNDCDGSVDEGFDADNDGWTTCAGDCDDNNPNANPSCPEACNAIDDDCDGSIDEDFDQDGDGYTTCNGDCDDTDASINPGAAEVCDGVDNDCDGAVDEGFDVDGDGYTVCNGDCDDTDPNVNPSCPEACNGVDDDCDGTIDEGFDADGDGYTVCNGDCDDTDAAINPGATEVCNGVDDDCDGVVPLDEIDLDGDGVSECAGDCEPGDAAIGPNALEVCDGVDNDCDGSVDEGFDADNDGVVDCVDTCPMIVDFDSDPYGNAIAAGADLAETYAAWGIHLQTWTVQNMSVTGMGIAFDSANPTGGDTDLATPGYGPGNSTALGNLLIGAENVVDNDGDGLVDDPDDNAGGAWFEFDFDAATCVNSLDFIDIEASEGPADVFLYNATGGQIAHYQVPGLGDNSVQTLSMGDCGVHSMLIDIYGSGAVDNLDVCVGGVDEVCDGVDNDGDGSIDEGFDADGDGVTSCGGDCDDTDASIGPNAPEVCDGVDNDCDGSVDEGFDQDADGWTTCGGDCDDTNPGINPSCPEACNGLDDDCDGSIDEDFDADGDGYTTCGGDCDDADAAINPGAAEVCDGIDNDCDGAVDDGFDVDGDGWTSCNGDCDDNNPNANPSCPEACNGIDDDCDGSIDEDFDADGDGYTTCGGDCDDTDAGVNPGAAEACNGVDDDCDGAVDEGFADDDNDGWTVCAGDCDDTDPNVNPSCPEACNGIDDDCDGSIDDGFDQDGDGIADCIDTCPMVIDFDNDPFGNPIAPGDNVVYDYWNWGVSTIEEYHDSAMTVLEPALAWDSENPGSMTELGTPHVDFGGPGVGAGGAAGEAGENDTGLGNVMKTTAGNTWYIVWFSSATCVHSVDLIDVDAGELPAQVILFDVNVNTITTYTSAALGDNSVETLDLGDTCGVYAVMVDFYAQGAWDNLDICVDPTGGPEQCGDGVDNDGDGDIDEGCGGDDDDDDDDDDDYGDDDDDDDDDGYDIDCSAGGERLTPSWMLLGLIGLGAVLRRRR